MPDCLIAFGSNLGNRQEIFASALNELRQTGPIKILGNSPPLETAAVGGPEGQEPYLNAAIRIETQLEPSQLHARLIKIENELGRMRRERWGARKIDLDLLLCGQSEVLTEELTIPHPRMSFRRFVLQPACEIASDMIHPPSRLDLQELLARLDERENLIVVVGSEMAEAFGSLRENIAKFRPEWSLQFVDDPDGVGQYEESVKLVAHVDGSDKQNAAASFAGATLKLPNDPVKIEIELLAAIEAMKALTLASPSSASQPKTKPPENE